MKKIIKLTESDLTRIVKRVIKENDNRTSLIDTIKDEGFNSTAEMVGGVKNLIKLLGVKTPTEFLHLFDDLNVFQNKNPNWAFFRYKPKYDLMIYNRKKGEIYVSYEDIWSVLKNNFSLNHSEIQELIKKWLDEVYNLIGVTPNAGNLTV